MGADIVKNKTFDCFILRGQLSAFINTDFYLDTDAQIHDQKAMQMAEEMRIANERWAEITKQEIHYSLNNIGKIEWLMNTPLMNEIINFYKSPHRRFKDCKYFFVREKEIQAEIEDERHSTDDNYPYRFVFVENGYKNLTRTDCFLLAIALVFRCLGVNPKDNNYNELYAVLHKTKLQFSHNEVRFTLDTEHKKGAFPSDIEDSKNLKSIYEQV